MATHPDVLILGGGVIGLTAAYFLAREGAKIQVLDKGDFGQEASWAGAGILPPGNPAHARHPFDLLRARSAVLFPTLSSELRERTGLDNGYVQSGGLELLGPGSQAAAHEWRGEGIAVQSLEEKEVRQLEPALAPGLGAAVFLPEMAQLRNPRHLQALLAACNGLGIGLRPGCAAHGWIKEGSKITGVQTLAGPIHSDKFLLATGAWTDPLLEPLGWRPGIVPIRGQIALLHTGPPLLRRILLWGARYLVPRLDGRVLVGSTEENVGFDKRTTAAGISDLLELACTLVPALSRAHVERTWAGLRPGSPDDLPYIGLVPGYDNLFLAAGHFRAGIQLSPATALILKELILGQPLTLPVKAFGLERAAL